MNRVSYPSFSINDLIFMIRSTDIAGISEFRMGTGYLTAASIFTYKSPQDYQTNMFLGAANAALSLSYGILFSLSQSSESVRYIG